MKKLLLILLTVMMGIGSLTLSAQSTLTVCDGSTSNEYVPFQGWNADANQHNQLIYPATLLTDMNGQSILQMVFYIDPGASNGSYTAADRLGIWTVSLGETTATTLDSLDNTTTLQQVYQGYFDCSTGLLTLEFDVPYAYNGGNLLVDLDHTAASYNRWYFLGVEATGASITYGAQRNFLSKCTFSYGTPPTCFKVTNQAIDATLTTSSSLTLTWTDALNTGATYNIYNMSDTTIVQAGITGTTYTVNNLAANTAYTFGIETDCGGGDMANGYATVSGRTACAAMSLPWTCGFEADEIVNTTQVNALPWCSSRYSVPSTVSYPNFPYSYSASTSFLHSGSRCLYFYGTTGDSYPDTMSLILPEVDVTLFPMSGNRLTFWARSSSASYDKVVYVGTLTDPTDISTYTLMDSITVTGTTYTKYSMPLTAVTGNPAYVVIMVMKGSGSLYIDDMTLEEMPSCLEVTNLAVTGTTTNSITLSWVDAGNTGATYTIYDMSDNTVVGTSNTTTYMVENLDANTLYTFGVQANCSAGDAPMTTVTGRTDCGIFTAPYTWTFEDMDASATPVCWTKIGSGTVNVYSSTTYSHASSSKCVRFSGSLSNLIVLPETQDEISDLQVRFWTRPESFTNTSCGTFSVGYVTDVTNDSSFVEVANYVYSDFNAIDEKTVTFAGAPTGARMAMRHNAGSTSWYWFIDDVTIEAAPSCLPVSALTADNITTTGATLNWMGAAASYNVYVVTPNDTTFVQNVTATTCDITGLNAMTNYTYGVRAVCGSDESPIVTVNFNTACLAVDLPYTETFASTSASRNCWNLVSMNTGNAFGTSNGMDFVTYNDREVLRFSSYSNHGGSGDYNQYGFSPLMNVSSNASYLSVSVTYATYGSNDKLYFGYVTATDTVWDPTEYTTTGGGDWQTETIVLPTTATQLAVNYYGNYSYYAWIDTVTIVEMSGSYCYPVTNLVVDTVSSSSVTLSWTDDSNTGVTYTIYNMADTSVVATGIAATSYEVTGLASMTGYTFGVVANCSATEASNIATVEVVTACGGTTCNITIVGADSWGDGWNGNAINVMQGGTLIGTFTLTTGSSLTETFAVCSDAPVTFTWVAGSYPGETSFEIFDGGNANVFTGDGNSMTGGSVFFTLNNACPTCITPAVTVDNVTTTSVTLSWTGSADSYDIYEGTTFVANVTTNTYTFNGLTTATAYTFGVQAICSATDSSSVATVNVTTDCDDITALPYNEGFENGLGCWSTLSGSTDGNPWNAQAAFSSGAIAPHTGSGMAASWSWNNSAMHANAWLISPKFILPNTTEPLSFTWWERTNPNYPDRYSVVISTTTNDTAAFTTVVRPYDTAAGSWTMQSIDLSAYAGQSIYIAFHHVDYDKNYLLIDDISLYQGGYIPPAPDTLTVTFAVNNPTMGTTTPAPGTYQYITGDTVHFSATPNAGYSFVGWEFTVGTESDTLGPQYIAAYFPANSMMSYGALTLTALFEAGSTPANDTMIINLSVNDPTLGTVTPAPGTYYLTLGDTLMLAATPNAGVDFNGWAMYVYGQGIGTLPAALNPYPLVVNNNMLSVGELTVVAMFSDSTTIPDSLTIIVNTDDATMGTTNPAPGTYHYAVGSTAALTAVPNTGYSFLYWIETVSAAGLTMSDTIYAQSVSMVVSQMYANMTLSVTAYFEEGNGLSSHLENDVVLYPNPARDYVDIRIDGDVDVKSMEVYDVYGKLINKVNVVENPTRINVSNLANGIYFVRVTTEAGVVTKQFVKK